MESSGDLHSFNQWAFGFMAFIFILLHSSTISSQSVENFFNQLFVLRSAICSNITFWAGFISPGVGDTIPQLLALASYLIQPAICMSAIFLFSFKQQQLLSHNSGPWRETVLKYIFEFPSMKLPLLHQLCTFYAGWRNRKPVHTFSLILFFFFHAVNDKCTMVAPNLYFKETFTAHEHKIMTTDRSGSFLGWLWPNVLLEKAFR